MFCFVRDYGFDLIKIYEVCIFEMNLSNGRVCLGVEEMIYRRNGFCY